jgi:hypothetical protein
MDLHNTHLLGGFICTSRPDEMEGGSWTNLDTLHIYYDRSQRLSFNFRLKTESNHGWSQRYEEGFVHQGSSRHEMHFEVRGCYEWGASWGMGYDGATYRMSTFGPQEHLQIFRLLNQKELTLAKEEGIVPGEAAMALVRHKGELVYYPNTSSSGNERDVKSGVPWEKF